MTYHVAAHLDKRRTIEVFVEISHDDSVDHT